MADSKFKEVIRYQTGRNDDGTAIGFQFVLADGSDVRIGLSPSQLCEFVADIIAEAQAAQSQSQSPREGVLLVQPLQIALQASPVSGHTAIAFHLGPLSLAFSVDRQVLDRLFASQGTTSEPSSDRILQ